VFALDVNGAPPDLRGARCEAFLCEPFVWEGVVEASANVSYLRFDGAWHRLYFDYGLIFWKPSEGPPVPESGDDVPTPSDVAAEAGVVGGVLEGYRMEPTERGSRVTFLFEDGRRIVVEDTDDRTGYSTQAA
jgi:hypothetical protein